MIGVVAVHSALTLLRRLDVDLGGNRDPSGLVLVVCVAGLALAVYLSVRTARVAREHRPLVMRWSVQEPASHLELGSLVPHTKEHHWVNPHSVTCDRMGCMWCDGGLEYCDVCNAFEGTTTTECVGRRMTETEEDQVYARKIDYRNGHWENIT